MDSSEHSLYNKKGDGRRLGDHLLTISPNQILFHQTWGRNDFCILEAPHFAIMLKTILVNLRMVQYKHLIKGTIGLPLIYVNINFDGAWISGGKQPLP
ncbi:hypothetical protein [Bacillus solitudinis]|uniref:hypothetical protein n=1 Tax=Bacillus solitudinis TaxID=2014074 RepID=UPI0012FDD219|nr:hypothetical protein [Bacillus solitudinis]